MLPTLPDAAFLTLYDRVQAWEYSTIQQKKNFVSTRTNLSSQRSLIINLAGYNAEITERDIPTAWHDLLDGIWTGYGFIFHSLFLLIWKSRWALLIIYIRQLTSDTTEYKKMNIITTKFAFLYTTLMN
jgi:hypothetical protein